MSLQSKVAEPAPQAATHRGQRPPSNVWSARVFEDIEWRRFEALCASLFGQAGFETRAQSHGADGGVDIWLYSQHAEGPAAVVQCKHWIGKAVGVKEIREFYGVMASHKLQRGTFATSSTFTSDARQFAKDNGISALDGQALLALISRRTSVQQELLLAIAYEGEYWRPTCASCGLKMVERSARRSFWGCVNFPHCRFTLPVRAVT
jgi:restriction system protein